MDGWTWGIMNLVLARKEGGTLSGSAWQVYLLSPFQAAYTDYKHPIPEGGRLRSDRFLMQENVGFTSLRRQGE